MTKPMIVAGTSAIGTASAWSRLRSWPGRRAQQQSRSLVVIRMFDMGWVVAVVVIVYALYQMTSQWNTIQQILQQQQQQSSLMDIATNATTTRSANDDVDQDTSSSDTTKAIIAGSPLIDSSSNPSARSSSKKIRQIPSLKDGGVLIFIHVPKTGGTTIGVKLNRHPNVTCPKGTVGPTFWGNMTQKVNRWIDNAKTTNTDEDTPTRYFPWSTNKPTNKTVYVLEIHSYPPYKGIVSLLDQWKHDIQTFLKLPVVMFSLLRDPIDFQISGVNYYCLGFLTTNKRCQGLTVPLSRQNPHVTNETLEDFSMPNVQCKFLSSDTGWTGPHVDEWTNKTSVTQQECHEYTNHFIRQMDWIGLTSRMNETAAFLEQILPPLPSQGLHEGKITKFSELFTKLMKNNKSNNFIQDKFRSHQIQRSNVSDTLMTKLHHDNVLDYELVKTVEDQYKIENVVVV